MPYGGRHGGAALDRGTSTPRYPDTAIFGHFWLRWREMAGGLALELFSLSVRVLFGLFLEAVLVARRVAIQLFLSPVAAGYPSPAQDYTDGALDLNEHLVSNPAATFFVRASGESMRDAGIFDKDILVVDRSVSPRHGHVVVAVVDGEFTVKRYSSRNGTMQLLAANKAYPPISAADECLIWGVVTYSIHAQSLCHRQSP